MPFGSTYKMKDVLDLEAYSMRWTSGGAEKFRVGDREKFLLNFLV